MNIEVRAGCLKLGHTTIYIFLTTSFTLDANTEYVAVFNGLGNTNIYLRKPAKKSQLRGGKIRGCPLREKNFLLMFFLYVAVLSTTKPRGEGLKALML